MVRTPVESSDVVSVGYDENEMLMEIEFRTGAVYIYYDVPKDFYLRFMAAESKGKFVNYVIKRSGLAYEKVLG